MKYIKSNFLFILLVVLSFGILIVNIKINIFRYQNFDYGKFDLGNMTQMVWNTMHGRFMYLTDYFGTNMPRWAMSHVDPILVMFVPLFAIWQSPLTLVISQLVLITFSSLLVYAIAFLKLKSKLAAFLLGVSFLLYPAVGFILAWTGFHGVSAVIPFFLGAFYVFENMYMEKRFTRKGLIVFWILLVLCMMGKEQIPLYVFLYGLFILVFREKKKLGISMMVVGFVWFALAFFVIIPKYAHIRIGGYDKFAKSLDMDTSLTTNVSKPNYFMSRYEEFGGSYSEMFVNMLLNPKKAAVVFFGGDKADNLSRTFLPLALLPLAHPFLLIISFPDFLINYMTTEAGIGTSEIYNHRVSMIIPVLFISTIYAIAFLSSTTKNLEKKMTLLLCAVVVLFNGYTSYKYNNPVYLWLTQAVQKRLSLVGVAFAKTDTNTIKEDLKVGDVIKLSPLENNDRECAKKVVNAIPDSASVSGPDYLGAHLSMRETYAIFPALYKEADYVIVDVFSRKIITILDADVSLIRDVVEDIVKDENYKLDLGCGNLFVFKRVGPHNKAALLPLQEKFRYDEKYNLEVFQSLTVVDYELPESITRGENAQARMVYTKRDNDSLDGYFLFMSFLNKDTGELYQMANLASFGMYQLTDWVEDHYFVEDLEIALPMYLDPGDYKVFVGMSNIIRTRSMFLGDVKVY
ncbi:MAG: DUF2079 domain-containing protein [Patescibacteria group bacterium]|jgi:uncharacterized membrane protein